MAKKVGKVSEFDIDWNSGVFTCCADHVMTCQDDAHEGMVITCDHCDKEMVLQKQNGQLMWVGR